MNTFEEFFSEQKKKHIDAETVKRILDGASPEECVVSFDVFDTLLVRPSVRPRDIFYLLQKQVREKYGLDFCKLRMKAEERLGDPYASLDDLWKHIGKRCRLAPEITAELREAEVRLETDLCVKRPELAEVYAYAVEKGFRVIAVSDMYLPSEVILELLRKNGYGDVKRVYVSCEEKARKSTGELYRRVLEAEGLASPSGLIHIGDNFESDVRIPLDQGITAVWYPSIWELAAGEGTRIRKTFRRPYFSKDAYTRLLISFTILYRYLKDGDRIQGDIRSLEEYTEEYLAPVAVVIALNLGNDPELRNGCRQILFAARDGYIPHLVYRKLAPLIGGLPGKYLYVSRMALSWNRFESFDDMLRSSKHSEEKRLDSYLKAYISDEEVLASALKALTQKERGLNIGAKQERETAAAALQRIRELLQPYFEEQRRLAGKYYNDTLSDCGKRAIVFDCGYGGSVSDGLMKATGQKYPVDKYYLWQNVRNRIQDRRLGTKTVCLFAHDVRNRGLNLIFEELFSPLTGTCTGFYSAGGRLVPRFEPISYSEEMREDCRSVRDSCLRFTDCFAGLFRPYLSEFHFSAAADIAGAQRRLLTVVQSSAIGLFRNFRFPDILRQDNESLTRKLYHNILFEHLRGTGMDERANYLSAPLPRIEGETPRLGIHLHLYNRRFCHEILLYLREFPLEFDLLVTVTDEEFGKVLKTLYTPGTLPKLRRLIVLPVENRGRDVAPWILGTAEYQEQYDLMCHIHGKESTQYGGDVGERWRNYLFANLLSPEAVLNTVGLFREDPSLGCVFPRCFGEIEGRFRKKVSPVEPTERGMLTELLHEELTESEILFSAGTMLWYRPKALTGLFHCGITLEDFPEEPIRNGGTIAHAIERCPALFAKREGYSTGVFTQYPERRSYGISGVLPRRGEAGELYPLVRKAEQRLLSAADRYVPQKLRSAVGRSKSTLVRLLRKAGLRK